MAIKIIKKGNDTFFANCDRCNTQFSYQINDIGTRMLSSNSNIDCPFCGNHLTHNPSNVYYDESGTSIDPKDIPNITEKKTAVIINKDNVPCNLTEEAIDASINHFNSQQKRYVKTHNGTECPHYANAISALNAIYRVVNPNAQLLRYLRDYLNIIHPDTEIMVVREDTTIFTGTVRVAKHMATLGDNVILRIDNNLNTYPCEENGTISYKDYIRIEVKPCNSTKAVKS